MGAIEIPGFFFLLFPIEEEVVVRMMANPEPLEAIRMIRGQRPVMQTYTHRMDRADLFESK